VSVDSDGATRATRTVPAGAGSTQLTIQLFPRSVTGFIASSSPVTEVLERHRLVVARGADGYASGWVLEPTSSLVFGYVPLQSTDQLEVRFDGRSRAAVGVRRGATGLIGRLMGVDVLPAPLTTIDDVRSSSAMLVVPDGPVDGTTLRTWYRLNQTGQPTRLSPESFMDVRPIEGDTRFFVWKLDGSGQPVVAELSTVGQTSSYVSDVPVPRLSRVGVLTPSTRTYWGLEGEDCLRRRGTTPPCRLWSLRVDPFAGRIEASVLSEEVVDFEVQPAQYTYTVGVLERSRFVIHRPGIPLEVGAENLTLPSDVAEEGRLVVSGRARAAEYLVLTADGLFWSPDASNRWRLAASDVLALLPVTLRSLTSTSVDALAVQVAEGASCATGACRYLELRQGQVAASPALRGSDVRLSVDGVIAAVGTSSCPVSAGQPCTILNHYGFAAQSTPTHIGVGEFVVRPGGAPVFGLRSSLRGPGLIVESPLTADLHSLSNGYQE
jgi:hypothetical protein